MGPRPGASAQPPETARLNEVRVGRANRVSVDAFGLDLRSAPPFDRVVDPDDQLAAGSESRGKHSQQHLRDSKARRSRFAKDSASNLFRSASARASVGSRSTRTLNGCFFGSLKNVSAGR
jgi:hypothetical protein